MPKKIGVKPYGASPFATQVNTFGGAAANGANGAQTPASQANAASQRSGGAHAPTSALGDFSSAWGSALQPSGFAPQSAQARYYAAALGAPPQAKPDVTASSGPRLSSGPMPQTLGATTQAATAKPSGSVISNDALMTAAPVQQTAVNPMRMPPTGPSQPGSIPPAQGSPDGGWHTPPFVSAPPIGAQPPSGPPPSGPATSALWGAQSQSPPPSGATAQGKPGDALSNGALMTAAPVQQTAGAPQFSASASSTFSASSDRSRPSETPTDPFYQKLYEYASNPGYEYLRDNPDMLRGYYAYVDQLRTALKANGFDGSQADHVDIVDYLKHQGQNSPQAGRNGYDTYMDIPQAPTVGTTPSGGSGGYTITTVGDPNNGVDPTYVALAGQYAQNPGYGWLSQSPIAVQEYQEWARATGNTDTDIVDWLKNQPAYADKTNPQAGRNGYDTFKFKKDPTTGQLVPRDATGGQPPQPPMNVPGQMTTTTNAAGTQVAPSAAGAGPVAGGGAPVTTPPATATSGSATQPSDATPTKPPTADTTPPIKPPTQDDPSSWIVDDWGHGGTNGGPIAGGGAPVTSGNATDPNAGPGTLASNIANLQNVLAPGFQWEQDQLTKAARAGAVSPAGGYADDSGGFGANLLNAQQGLAADQGKRLSDYATTAEQKNLDRALQYYMTNTQASTAKYQVDANTAIASMNADIQRLGITTNADIEQKKIDMSKYGIDQNDVLERYKAELALQGQKYSADASVNAAALQKAASASIAASNAATQRYVADLQRQTDLAQLAQNDTNSQRSYDLGVLGINSNIYSTDQNNLLRYLQLILSQNPNAQISGGLPFNLPGSVLNP